MTRRIIHNRLYFFLLLLLAATLPLSVYATTIIQFLLILNWIAEGNFKFKFQQLKNDRAFWVFTLLFILHIVGMAWSSDFQYGLKDLKIKLPVIVIPFLLASSDKLTITQLRQILLAFIVGCLVGSGASVLALLNILPADMSDFRNASLFISHIRFSLMIVLAIMFAGFLFLRKDKNDYPFFPYIYLLALAWLPVFLVILRSLSGLLILVIIVFFVSLYLVKLVSDRKIRTLLTLIIVGIPIVTIFYIGLSIHRFYDVEKISEASLDSLTVMGNPYTHVLEKKEAENGNYVWIYLCEEELEEEWKKISNYDYHGKADNGDLLKFTIIRYLSSKGLRKDALGLQQLDSLDIAAIESGIANHIYLNRFALYPRIYEVIWEFDRYRLGYNPNDKSLIQRYYYLKAGIAIASENLVFGVGTGDVRQAFEEYYESNDSPLRLERRRRAHNQYLTFAVAFGIPGLLICLLAIILPVFMKKRWTSFMAVIFLLTIGLSMLDEDTLETTPGAVMFGFFYALFIFGEKWPTRKSGK